MTTARYRAKSIPNEIVIEWEDANGNVTHSETFYATATIPADTLLQIMDAQQQATADGAGIREIFEKVLAFADAVFLPESAERYAAGMKSSEWPIDMPMLSWTIERLAEMYGGRPTAPPDPSSGGQSTTGTSSTGPSPSAESTSSHSTPDASSPPSTPS